MRRYANYLVWIFLIFCSKLTAFSNSKHAITHQDCGRLGDQLVNYSAARYLGYLTSVPFLYIPFRNSDKLSIDFQAFSYEQMAPLYESIFHINSAETWMEFFITIADESAPPTLFIVDYFPTDISEWGTTIFDRKLLLNIPWDNADFIHYLRQSLQPRVPIPKLTKDGYLNVAMHVRTFSGGDSVENSILGLPLKHPKLSYYVRQIRKIYELNLRRSMHVFIFSDTAHPLKLVKYFKDRLGGYDIIFDIQILENPDTEHVIQDFFAMQEFDVLIATQSNFSMMSSRLGDFDMVIFPVHVTGKYPNSDIDRVQLVSKKSSWFPYDVNVILKEEKLSLSNKGWFFDTDQN